MFEAAFVILSEINRLAQVCLCCNLPRGRGRAPRGWCNGRHAFHWRKLRLSGSAPDVPPRIAPKVSAAIRRPCWVRCGAQAIAGVCATALPVATKAAPVAQGVDAPRCGRAHLPRLARIKSRVAICPRHARKPRSAAPGAVHGVPRSASPVPPQWRWRPTQDRKD
jgi:hypothetical protein